MSDNSNPRCRWGWTLERLLGQVQGGHWEQQTLVNAIAARLDVEPKHVSVEAHEFLGRPFLRVEVAI